MHEHAVVWLHVCNWCLADTVPVGDAGRVKEVGVVATARGDSVLHCGVEVATILRSLKARYGSFCAAGVEDFMKGFASGRCVVPRARVVPASVLQLINKH